MISKILSDYRIAYRPKKEEKEELGLSEGPSCRNDAYRKTVAYSTLSFQIFLKQWVRQWVPFFEVFEV